VRQYAPQLPPGDIVRLLTILSESEERLSRSANTRMLVEVCCCVGRCSTEPSSFPK